MYTTSLFCKDTLIFLEPDPNGYFDNDENWVSPPPTEIEAEGNVQPFGTTSQHKKSLPQGCKSIDARYFYTRSADIKTTDEHGDQLASTTVIEGKTFSANHKGVWKSMGIMAGHYVYVLVKSPQNPMTRET